MSSKNRSEQEIENHLIPMWIVVLLIFLARSIYTHLRCTVFLVTCPFCQLNIWHTPGGENWN